jgi:hypothetical protein
MWFTMHWNGKMSASADTALPTLLGYWLDVLIPVVRENEVKDEHKQVSTEYVTCIQCSPIVETIHTVVIHM